MSEEVPSTAVCPCEHACVPVRMCAHLQRCVGMNVTVGHGCAFMCSCAHSLCSGLDVPSLSIVVWEELRVSVDGHVSARPTGTRV